MKYFTSDMHYILSNIGCFVVLSRIIDKRAVFHVHFIGEKVVTL
jgi:hypothetical protein